MNWLNSKATTCVADVGLDNPINYSALYILIPLEHIDISKCVFKRKNVIRHETEPGAVVYAGWGSYKRGIPHRFESKRNFCNATTLSMSLGVSKTNNEGRYVSLAVSTDKIHICGCKDEQEIRICVKYFLQRCYRVQEALDYVKKIKDSIMDYFRDNFKGYEVIHKYEDNTTVNLHQFCYNALKLYEKYGTLAHILDPYLSTVNYIEDAIVFIEWCCLIEHIVRPSRISYIDYHNIHYDIHLGINVDLASLAFLTQGKGYDVEFSNVNDTYVHIVIPYDELDVSTTKRKKSRYIINVYKTGAVKMYGPTFGGIAKEYDKYYKFIMENSDLIIP